METINKTNLFDIVSYVESACNPHLIRFEPGVYHSISTECTPAQRQILNEIIRIHDCSNGTAQMIYSTSWGQIQMMGFNLYGDLHYQKPFWEFSADPVGEVEIFTRFCQLKKIEFTAEQIAQNPTD